MAPGPVTKTTLTTVGPMQISGNFTSNTFTPPAMSFQSIEFDFTIDATDLADSTKSLSFNVNFNPSGDGVTFVNVAGFTWVGGPSSLSPSLSFPYQQVVGIGTQLVVSAPLALSAVTVAVAGVNPA